MVLLQYTGVKVLCIAKVVENALWEWRHTKHKKLEQEILEDAQAVAEVIRVSYLHKSDTTHDLMTFHLFDFFYKEDGTTNLINTHH